ncbi:MAG: hypothetical protein K2Z81_22545, partial [Cyanobacteria bacterium]|nr:hypothetical protein [Cyanobacteriota bacterium]
SGLVTANGKKLTASKAASSAFLQKPHEMIATIWKSWINSNLFDEFRRIDFIKGQNGKAKYAMTSPVRRREQIVTTLLQCPQGAWIRFDEFSRFMRASGNFFSVTSNPWLLYICDPNYGALGYSGSNCWQILEDRYILCFLFEYAATLGLIDVAFVNPEFGRRDFSHVWGTDDLPFLSRYDGLLYFKINDLGAYCLGKTDSYASSLRHSEPRLSVLPSGKIRLTNGELTVTQALLLSAFADQVSDDVWELSREKALESCEKGQRIDNLIKLFEELDDQPLPDQVWRTLDEAERRSKAVETVGQAILFYCRDNEVASEIASHPQTKTVCELSGTHYLVVKPANEARFRKAIRMIGYGSTVE